MIRTIRTDSSSLEVLIFVCFLAMLTSGCSDANSSSDLKALPAIENFRTSAAPDSTSEILGFAKAVRDSYELFLEKGMTEEIVSAGDRYILTYEPGEEFLAALYNLEFEDVVGVGQKELFTVYSAWAMLGEEATVIEEIEGGYSLAHPDYGSFSVVIENGLIVGGEGIDAGWTGTFRYEPDFEVLALLESDAETGG